jgi:hypothetical protein
MGHIIGTVTVDEFVHKTVEQTACNYRLITVPAGTYAVELDDRGYWAYVRFDGIRTDEHFVNRLFGSTSLVDKQGIGQPDRAFWQRYSYDVAERFATDPAWELEEGWKVEVTTHVSSYDGERRKSYKLAPIA